MPRASIKVLRSDLGGAICGNTSSVCEQSPCPPQQWDKILQLSNTGTAPLTWDPTAGPIPYPEHGSVEPGASVTIGVQFLQGPLHSCCAGLTWNESFELLTNDPAQDVISFPLTGNALVGKVLPTQSELDFTAPDQWQDLTVKNVGNLAFIPSQLFELPTGSAFQWDVQGYFNDGDTMLQPGESRTYGVQFSPPGSGTYDETLVLGASSEWCDKDDASVALHGTAP